MDHRTIEPATRQRLVLALRANAFDGWALRMDRDTTFAGITAEVPDEEVVSAVKSVPMHY